MDVFLAVGRSGVLILGFGAANLHISETEQTRFISPFLNFRQSLNLCCLSDIDWINVTNSITGKIRRFLTHTSRLTGTVFKVQFLLAAVLDIRH